MTLKPSKTAQGFVTRTIALVGGVVVVTLGAAISSMFASTDELNREHMVMQKARLLHAMESKGTEAKSNLAVMLTGRSWRSFANDPVPETILSIGQRAWSVHGFKSMFILDATGEAILGFEQGHRSSGASYNAYRNLVDETVMQARDNYNNASGPTIDMSSPGPEIALGHSALAFDGYEAARVTAIPLKDLVGFKIEGKTGPYTAVAIDEASSALFSQMANDFGLGSLKLTRTIIPAATASFPLNNGMGVPSAYLSWTPDRPGDAMLKQFAITILVTTMLIVAMFAFLLGRLRAISAAITKREEQVERLAGVDDLSSLPNRRTFDQRVDQELARVERSGGGLAVMMLDLDKFKAVNDTYGHKAGDELIRQVSKRLSDLMRGADMLSRFGGDEFSILQTDVSTPHEAAALGQRVLDTIMRPFQIGEHEVSVGVSIGIALAPDNAMERENLQRLADTALYQAKNEGRNRYSFFERNMDRALQLKRIVAEDLRNAIENDDLRLHFQPQVSADGTKLLGVEALVRWNHPVHGNIPPAEFIGIAEERGLIMPLSAWVLRNACLAAKDWHGVRLAVNVSPVEFRNKDFVANVARTITETGFDASRLELELTEGVLVEDADAAEAAMVELRGLGCGLALDDFGTGYSSLIYLRRFAFDKIKIDRSFLEYMETTGESAILVHSVVHLGRALGLRVCAEGVETAEQHRFLQAVGCHELQGYFFSRPVPPEQIDLMVEPGGRFATSKAA
jgi:diguanylate cyclase